MSTTSGTTTKPRGRHCTTGLQNPAAFPLDLPLSPWILHCWAQQPISCVSPHTARHSTGKAGHRHQHYRKYWFLIEVLLIFLLYNNPSHRILVCVQTFLLCWFISHISATIRGKTHVFHLFIPSSVRLNISFFFFNWHFQLIYFSEASASLYTRGLFQCSYWQNMTNNSCNLVSIWQRWTALKSCI